MRFRVTCNAKEPIASKYCFVSKSIIHTSKHVPGPRKTVGVIFAFDKSPDVSKRIEAVGTALKAKGNYVIDQPELMLMEICPVEVSDNVYIQFFNKQDAPAALDGMDSELTSTDVDELLFHRPDGGGSVDGPA